MSRECFEIGTLQAFLDGETAAELSTRISDHVLECDGCATQLAGVEDESAFVFSALDRELNALVPTQRLWTRINETIETEKSQASIWNRIYAFISVYVASPSLTAAAGVLLFVGIAAFVWTSSPDVPTVAPIASNAPSQAAQPKNIELAANPVNRPSTIGDGVDEQLPPAVDEESVTRRPAVMNAAYTPRKADSRQVSRTTEPDVRPTTLEYIPGEESYIRTIAELNEQVETQKDRVLPPSSRVAFERDLAVVSDAIARTKKVVRQNPDNQSARQVLYAAYQDKIDLLNSVGDREELMASLR